MKRFEYKIKHFFLSKTDKWLDSHTIERTFNNLGMEGWELVKVDDKVAFFKREITGARLEALEAELEAKLEAKLEAEHENKEAEEKVYDEIRKSTLMTNQMSDVERAYYLVENTSRLQHSSEVYGYIAKLKHEEITFDEFMEKMDEMMRQKN